MTATISQNARVAALRLQLASLVSRIEKGDLSANDEFVSLAEKAGDEFERQVGDIMERANAAMIRLAAVQEEIARQPEPEPEVQVQDEPEEPTEVDEEEQPVKDETANLERRTKIARIFEDRNFQEAATAVLTELEGANGKTLAWISATLVRDIPESGIYGWAKHYAYLYANEANSLAREKGLDSAASLFSRFMREINSANGKFEILLSVPQNVHPRLISEAKGALDRAVLLRFGGWALKAIEQMLSGPDDNIVSDLLRNDPELAGSVSAKPAGQRAITLIKTLEQRVSDKIDSAKNDLAKSKAEDEQRRAAERLRREQKAVERSQHDREYRNSVKGHNPSADSFKKKGNKKSGK